MGQLFKVVIEVFLTASQVEGFVMSLKHLIKRFLVQRDEAKVPTGHSARGFAFFFGT